MPFGLGFFAVAGAGAAGAYDLLETQVLTGSQTSISFSSLSQYASTYKHLQIRGVALTDSWITLRINGDTASNYSAHELRGNGSNVTSSATPNNNYIFLALAQSSSGPTSFVCDIPDAFQTTKNKVIRNLGGTTFGGNVISLTSGAWLNTNAISSLQVEGFATTRNLLAGSRFSLFGIKGA